MRRVLLGIAAIATPLLIAFIIFKATQKPASQELGQLVTKTNLSCPVMVDNQTRLDGARMVSSDEVEYSYTFVYVEAGQADADEIKSKMQPSVIEQVKTSPEMQPFREHDVTLDYTFKDRSGTVLFTIKVEPKDYSTNI